MSIETRNPSEDGADPGRLDRIESEAWAQHPPDAPDTAEPGDEQAGEDGAGDEHAGDEHAGERAEHPTESPG